MDSKTVLVFDDDPDLLNIFNFLFEESGWQVHSFQNCDNVVEMAIQYRPLLILMDNWIPSIGGIRATQLLKANEEVKNIPVIYISANNDGKALSEQAGADCFIAKPFDLDELLALADVLVNKS
ncbi:DNA-binding response OmpR family regulator [Pedobacter sp. W3I1]|uniref:response regulator n=1 Tax=Pedobacter sp. W3I1 TaxID=3042291 RepID=UPI0027810649|nr:response regulator [Pedobacter sp. W3I1]MDQ0638679.1 DNA-binding response OmpR family regulator [Pedobacter sp. W3I1]